eukprot:471003-Pleurochrysis_carterae.AAC.3
MSSTTTCPRAPPGAPYKPGRRRSNRASTSARSAETVVFDVQFACTTSWVSGVSCSSCCAQRVLPDPMGPASITGNLRVN